MNVDHGLSQRHVETVRRILATYADHITQVDLFGSRAMGNYRPNSDIDIVLHGDIPEQYIDRLSTLFDESNLPVSVDVKGYEYMSRSPLKRHVDRVRLCLFTQDELRAARQHIEPMR